MFPCQPDQQVGGLQHWYSTIDVWLWFECFLNGHHVAVNANPHITERGETLLTQKVAQGTCCYCVATTLLWDPSLLFSVFFLGHHALPGQSFVQPPFALLVSNFSFWSVSYSYLFFSMSFRSGSGFSCWFWAPPFKALLQCSCGEVRMLLTQSGGGVAVAL
jgi:hypothetical protein